MRFDRRKTYPSSDDQSIISAFRAIVPKRIGGVIKQLGNPKVLLPINRAVTQMTDHTQYLISQLKFNKGGFSDLGGVLKGLIQGGDDTEILPTSLVFVMRGGEVRVPTSASGTYDFTVDWGDGKTDAITAYDQAENIHLYDVEGDYVIVINGTFTNLSYTDAINGPYRPTLISVLQWGSCAFVGDSIGMFVGMTNLQEISAEDAPDLTTCTGLVNTFNQCTAMTVCNIGHWDISNLTKLQSIFNTPSSLASIDLNGWDVSNITIMSGIFQNPPAGMAISVDQWTPLSATTQIALYAGANGMRLEDYDKLLNINTGWPSRGPLPTLSQFTVQNSKYTAGGDAEAGRNALLAIPWTTIIDGGPA